MQNEAKRPSNSYNINMVRRFHIFEDNLIQQMQVKMHILHNNASGGGGGGSIKIKNPNPSPTTESPFWVLDLLGVFVKMY